MTDKIKYIFRVSWAAIQGYNADDCSYKASALTFYTLLSVVPILAIAFGIATSIGLEHYLEKGVSDRLSDQPELAHKIIAFSYSALKQTRGGIIAAVGIIGLVWTSVQLFGTIEYSFNIIWHIKKGRSYARQARDYLIALIFCSIFFVISSTFTLFTISVINKVAEQNTLIKFISSYLLLAFGLSPLIINWLLLSFIYIFMPNAKIPWKPALIAAFVASLIYQIVQWVYIHFQIGVASYGAIYGSFAALPLFLIWINTSWAIVLGGAELAYHLSPSSFSPLGHFDLNNNRAPRP